MADPFALLVAGHAVGDWIVQTDWQAAHKARPAPYTVEFRQEEVTHRGGERGMRVVGNGPYAGWLGYQVYGERPDREYLEFDPDGHDRWISWLANQSHMLTYHLTLALFLIPRGLSGAWAPSGVALAFSWVLHSFIDRRWPVRWLLEHTGSRSFAKTPLGAMAADQALHLATLGLMAAYLGARW